MSPEYSPEFLAVLGERVYVARWVVLLPICLGLLAVVVSVVKSRKGVAFLYVTLFAIASVAIPGFMIWEWLYELSNVAISVDEKSRVHDFESSAMLAGVYDFILGAVFWIISVLILSARLAINLVRKRKEKRRQYNASNEF